MYLDTKKLLKVIIVCCIWLPFSTVAQNAGQDNSQNFSQESEQTFLKELRLLDDLQIYNRQLQLQIDSQQESIIKLKGAIKESTTLDRKIIPIMTKMVDSLDEFISIDIPFKLEERRDGMLSLRAAMVSSQSSLFDQIRQLLSVYQIEQQYGYTYETYSGSLTMAEKVLTVDFLRIGRLGYYYQTKDGRTSGMWSRQQSDWVSLPAEYNRHLRKAIRVASKAVAPELINLPLTAPEDV